MSSELQNLIENARKTKMSAEQRETQRISFSYGNTRFENDQITRDTVVHASKVLRDSGYVAPEPKVEQQG